MNAALRAELEANPRTLVYGEDVGKAGGIFGAAQRLQRGFSEARVFDLPIAGNAILGSAIVAAASDLLARASRHSAAPHISFGKLGGASR